MTLDINESTVLEDLLDHDLPGTRRLMKDVLGEDRDREEAEGEQMGGDRWDGLS